MEGLGISAAENICSSFPLFPGEESLVRNFCSVHQPPGQGLACWRLRNRWPSCLHQAPGLSQLWRRPSFLCPTALVSLCHGSSGDTLSWPCLATGREAVQVVRQAQENSLPSLTRRLPWFLTSGCLQPTSFFFVALGLWGFLIYFFYYS